MQSVHLFQRLHVRILLKRYILVTLFVYNSKTEWERNYV